MIFRPLILKVLTFRTQQNVLIVQRSDLFQESLNRWLKQTCTPSAYISYVKPKTINLIKAKKDLPVVELWRNITVQELADILKTDVDTIISLIPKNLVDPAVNPNTKIETQSIINQIAKSLGRKCLLVANPNEVKVRKTGSIETFKQEPSKPENLVKRPPVVTIMGHVDHGKTTLLDALRNSFIVQQEFGGITQHIGAFSVEVKSGEKITFIDTPGHAAFTTMRSRGAKVTDIVVLVIAADDGVMEQTVESINIANQANVPIIVAVNKIDKPSALSIDHIKEKLLLEGIQVEDKGGNVQLVPISALKKINLDLLVEVILVEAEMMDLKGDPTGLVEGVVIESTTDKRGKLATIIVKRGTLEKGKIMVAGKAQARVRMMFDENGKEYKEVLPSTPVQILGWKDLPAAGDEVIEVKSEKEAKKIAKAREREEMIKKVEDDSPIIAEKAESAKEEFMKLKMEYSSLPNYRDRNRFFFEKFKNTTVFDKKEELKPTLNLIVKGDVHGSLEVLLDVIGSYTCDEECVLNVIESSVGDVTQNDIELAQISDAMIFAFNVNVHPAAKEFINDKVNIHFHNVLYKLIDDLKSELNLKIPPKDEEEVLGEAEVLENFMINVGRKKVPVAGSKCLSGELKKEHLFKVMRNDEVIYRGKLVSMKHLKNEVRTIQKNTECGLMFDSFSDQFKPGDKIVCYKIIKVPQKTSWDPGF